MTRASRAVVFVKSTDFDPNAAQCMQYCEQQGYQFQGIVRDDWNVVERMFADDQATVAIVATAADLDPNRKRRIEIVANQPAARYEHHPRTARIIRPDAGA